jgi:putative PIN family toxin of toxin-antitoxin system
MTSIILDTNIHFSAFVFDREVLKLVDYCYQNCVVYLSDEGLQELKQKFFGEKIKRCAKNYQVDVAREYVTKIEQETRIVSVSQTSNLCRDPKDNMFLDLASAIQADYLITGDKDLLALENFENTQILKPSEFLAKI